MKVYYINYNIVLVINPNGQMRTLYTPFRVFNTVESSWVYVEEVTSSVPKAELFYVIGRSGISCIPSSKFGFIFNQIIPNKLPVYDHTLSGSFALNYQGVRAFI